MIIRDVAGTAVAALCINADLSVWDSVQKVLDGMYGSASRSTAREAARDVTPIVSPTRPHSTEMSVGASAGTVELGSEVSDGTQSVDSLAATLIDNAIAKIKLPVEIMHKRHKLEVVRDLKARGIFQLRDGVDMVAHSLAVTRFTIYNYLNQLSEDDGGTVEKASEDEPAESNPPTTKE